MRTAYLAEAARPNPAPRPRLAWAGSAWALLFAVMLGCTETPVVPEPPPPNVTVEHPQERDLLDYDRYNGWARAAETVEVRARVRGHIKEVHFTDGQIVQQGDLLFELDPRPFQQNIDRARDQLGEHIAELKLADANNNRNKTLFEQKAITKAEYDRTIAALGTAEARVASQTNEIKRLELELEYSRITAEISGRIGRALLTTGNLVNAGGSDPLLTSIAALDPIQVYFSVDERSLLKYREWRSAVEQAKQQSAAYDASEQSEVVPAAAETAAAGEARQHPVKDLKIPFEFGLETDDGYPHAGAIDFADNTIDSETGTIEVRGVAPNPDGQFLAGARIRVRVPSSDNYRAIVLPDLAILSDQDQRYVLVVNDENVVVRRTVTPGQLLDDGMRVILPSQTENENLSPDDWVVVLGLQRARLNYPVNPVDAGGKPVERTANAGQAKAAESPVATTDASGDASH
jgi:RND family efflux transporter MFP subunit